MLYALLPENRPSRVVGYCSGSGNTLWEVYRLQKELEQTPQGSPFEVVGIFTDDPGSKCVQTAGQYGLQVASLDIRKFYEEHDAPMGDQNVRRAYDTAALPLVEAMQPDMILLAGYVWALTDVVTGKIFTAGVHPGDLTDRTPDGTRLLAGANGVKAAFRHHRTELRASSYLATNALDGGPVMITSPAVPVDYEAHPDEEERFRYYLKLINAQNRLVGARTVLEIANGNFQTDGNGKYFYKGKEIPLGIKFEDWNEDAIY